MKTYPLLQHPKSKMCHRPARDWPLESGLSDGTISTSLAVCGANLPGQPPPSATKRQWWHGSFDVVNLTLEETDQARLCKRCFPERRVG